MIKKILIFSIFSILSFSKNYTIKEVIKIITENEKFECNPDKKIIKFEGVNFIGHLDEFGKPYGEWKLRDNSIMQCFLDNEKIGYESGRYFSKRNNEFSLLISYSDEKNEDATFIQFIAEPILDNKVYLFSRKNGKYKLIKNKIMTLTENIPLYNLVVIE